MIFFASLTLGFNRQRLVELRLKYGQEVGRKTKFGKPGISRYELFLSTGIERATIEKIEKGEIKDPRFETVEKLSKFFSVNMETFSTGCKL